MRRTPSQKAACSMNRKRQAGDKAGGPAFKDALIAGFTLAALGVHLVLRLTSGEAEAFGVPLPTVPLLAVLAFGGVPLVLGLAAGLLRGEFGSDLLAGLS